MVLREYIPCKYATAWMICKVKVRVPSKASPFARSNCILTEEGCQADDLERGFEVTKGRGDLPSGKAKPAPLGPQQIFL